MFLSLTFQSYYGLWISFKKLIDSRHINGSNNDFVCGFIKIFLPSGFDNSNVWFKWFFTQIFELDTRVSIVYDINSYLVVQLFSHQWPSETNRLPMINQMEIYLYIIKRETIKKNKNLIVNDEPPRIELAWSRGRFGWNFPIGNS